MPPRRRGRTNPPRLRNNHRGFDAINDDILCEILGKLCAKRFAIAACVSRTWNRASRVIMAKPRFVTAVSLHQDPKRAMKEAVRGILSKLIRPQFVIACVGETHYNLDNVHQYVRKKFGRTTPIITNFVEGVVGDEVGNNELIEVTCTEVSNEHADYEDSDGEPIDDDIGLPLYGLVLIVGWIPDLQVEAIPLTSPVVPECENTPHVPNDAINRFIGDIQRFSLGVSGTPDPAALILFGEKETATKSPLLQNIDAAFPRETAVVGHFNNHFRYRSKDPNRRTAQYNHLRAAALVFARNQNKPPEIGRTEFTVPCMNCVTQVSLPVSVVSINSVEEEKNRTFLSARDKRDHRGIGIINDDSDRVQLDDFYIGIEKNLANKDVASSSTSVPPSTSINLHGVQMGVGRAGELVVKGDNIRRGDIFWFYKTNLEKGLAMNGIEPKNLNNNNKVFAGLIFANMNSELERMTRGYYDFTNPYLDLFEGTPLGGWFTKFIAKRSPVLTAWNDGDEEVAVGDCVTSHKGIQYLIMSHIQAAALGN